MSEKNRKIAVEKVGDDYVIKVRNAAFDISVLKMNENEIKRLRNLISKEVESTDSDRFSDIHNEIFDAYHHQTPEDLIKATSKLIYKLEMGDEDDN